MVPDQTRSTAATILDPTGRVAVDLTCLDCGNNLRAQPIGGECPGCGHAVARSAARFLPQLDDEGRVAGDVPCVNCGYNLRTQPAGGICPECANPVVRSISGYYLHHAPAAWVRRLANGALLLVIALCGALWIVAGSAGLATAISGGPASAVILESILPMSLIIVGVVGLWFIIRGLLLLTTPNPTAQFRREGFTARRLVRYCLIVLLVSVVATMTLIGLQSGAPLGLQFSPRVTFAIIFVTTALVQLILPLATLRHIATLMRQVPRRALVIFAKIEFWGLLIAGLFHFIGASTFAPVAAGPTMPVPTSATGPSLPTAVTTTSSPALTALGYIPPPPASVTYAGPVSPLFFLVTAVMNVSRSSLLGISIAGLVLLILVWRALADAARLADASAVGAPTK